MTTASKSYWEERIQKWQQSSCNMTEFCRRECLSIYTFKCWKYKLASSKNSEPDPQDLVKITEPAKLVPVKVAEEVTELTEISQAKPKKSSDIYIQIGHKSSLIIPDNFKMFQNRNSCQNTWSAAEFMIFEGNTRRIHLISVKCKLSGILL